MLQIGLFRVGDNHIINMNHVTSVRFVDGDLVIFDMINKETLEFSQSALGHRVFHELSDLCDMEKRYQRNPPASHWPSLEQLGQAQGKD